MKISVIRSLVDALKPPVEAVPIDTSLQESPARSAGDAARDAGDFIGAAEGYREHLKDFPNDFPIWVQLGHMLKDTNRLVEADQAYDRALALRPDDTDLLLHYGTLKRTLGKPKRAAELLIRAAEIDLSPTVAEALSASAVTKHLTESVAKALAAQGARGLAGRLEGLFLSESAGVITLGPGHYRLIDNDPWFCLRIMETPEDAALAGLAIRMAGTDEHGPPRGRLYLDYGDGFDPNEAIDLPPCTGTETLDVTVALARPDLLRAVRFDPHDGSTEIRIDRIAFVPDIDIEAAIDAARAAYPTEISVEDDLTAARHALRSKGLRAKDAHRVTRLLSAPYRSRALHYEFWRRRWVEPTRDDYVRITEMTAELPKRPTFSFVMPVYNTPVGLLQECLDSLLNQTYQDFEICVADDRSPDPAVLETLERYARRDPRIKIAARRHNGHISAASNSALALATGEWIVLVDHDDLVPDYCLFTVAWYINRHPDGQVFFSDEDKVTLSGERVQPYFKGSYDPFLMYGHNMVSHLGVYRRDLLEQIGGFRLGLEGSQDYDLLLRCAEIVGDDAVVHIPHVLYHWRAIPGSTAVSADQKGYAIHAAGAAINGHFDRRGLPLRSVQGFAPGCTGLTRTRNFTTTVSIIIPTRDHGDELQACLDSILASDHAHSEIIVIDNGTTDQPSLGYLNQIEADGIARVIRHDAPFNFSEINNIGAQAATGEILCFLNNDTEVLTTDWLQRARALLAVPGVGMVGARLLYPDGTLQHFGLITGMADHKVAGAPHLGQPGGDAGYFGKARLMQQFSAVTAACMFVRAEIFAGVGGFDPDLRVAYNDVDLCLKVRAAGHKIVGDPDITLIHKESKTRGSDASGERAERLAAEAATMRDRWARVLDNDPFYSPNLSLERGDFVVANPPRVPVPWRMDRPRVAEAPSKRVKPVPPPPPWSEAPPPPSPRVQRFADLPPEVSPDVLRRRYEDLADRDDAFLLSHWETHGRSEGRIAADVALRELFLPMIDPDARLLEIGPYFTPAFKGPNVRYLDVFDAESLRTFARAEGADPEGCPAEIHYTNGLGEAAGADFDAVFSSHAIEHQPDLVTHLQQAAAALKPGGLYWIICPDKRFCFDQKRPASTIADVLDARGRTRNTRRNVIDQVVLMDHNDPVRHWQGDHDDVSSLERERLAWALQHIEEKGEDYIDVHAWHLTPPVLRRVLSTLIELEMIPFRSFRVYDTPVNRNEFMAVLARDD